MTTVGAGRPRDDNPGAPVERAMSAGNRCPYGGNRRDDRAAPCGAGKPGDDQRTGPIEPVMTDDKGVPVDSVMTDDYRFGRASTVSHRSGVLWVRGLRGIHLLL